MSTRPTLLSRRKEVRRASLDYNHLDKKTFGSPIQETRKPNLRVNTTFSTSHEAELLSSGGSSKGTINSIIEETVSPNNSRRSTIRKSTQLFSPSPAFLSHHRSSTSVHKSTFSHSPHQLLGIKEAQKSASTGNLATGNVNLRKRLSVVQLSPLALDLPGSNFGSTSPYSATVSPTGGKLRNASKPKMRHHHTTIGPGALRIDQTSSKMELRRMTVATTPMTPVTPYSPSYLSLEKKLQQQQQRRRKSKRRQHTRIEVHKAARPGQRARLQRRHSIDHHATALEGVQSTLLDSLREYYIGDHTSGTVHTDLYSDKNLLRREAIRFDPKIVALLNKIWNIADSDRSKRIERKEYVNMFEKLARVLTQPGALTEVQIKEMANEEFLEDSSGSDHLNYDAFVQSWFQLTDKWTETISIEEYRGFLDDVLNCMCKINVLTGKMVFREAHEVVSLECYRLEKEKAGSSGSKIARKLATRQTSVMDQEIRITHRLSRGESLDSASIQELLYDKREPEVILEETAPSPLDKEVYIKVDFKERGPHISQDGKKIEKFAFEETVSSPSPLDGKPYNKIFKVEEEKRRQSRTKIPITSPLKPLRKVPAVLSGKNEEKREPVILTAEVSCEISEKESTYLAVEYVEDDPVQNAYKQAHSIPYLSRTEPSPLDNKEYLVVDVKYPGILFDFGTAEESRNSERPATTPTEKIFRRPLRKSMCVLDKRSEESKLYMRPLSATCRRLQDRPEYGRWKKVNRKKIREQHFNHDTRTCTCKRCRIIRQRAYLKKSASSPKLHAPVTRLDENIDKFMARESRKKKRTSLRGLLRSGSQDSLGSTTFGRARHKSLRKNFQKITAPFIYRR
eukprot:g3084.t1